MMSAEEGEASLTAGDGPVPIATPVSPRSPPPPPEIETATSRDSHASDPRPNAAAPRASPKTSHTSDSPHRRGTRTPTAAKPDGGSARTGTRTGSSNTSRRADAQRAGNNNNNRTGKGESNSTRPTTSPRSTRPSAHRSPTSASAATSMSTSISMPMPLSSPPLTMTASAGESNTTHIEPTHPPGASGDRSPKIPRSPRPLRSPRNTNRRSMTSTSSSQNRDKDGMLSPRSGRKSQSTPHASSKLRSPKSRPKSKVSADAGSRAKDRGKDQAKRWHTSKNEDMDNTKDEGKEKGQGTVTNSSKGKNKDKDSRTDKNTTKDRRAANTSNNNSNSNSNSNNNRTGRNTKGTDSDGTNSCSTSTTSSSEHNGSKSGSGAVSRRPLKGFRGGKKWNIMEDTPGGHAEKMVLVVAIEFDDDDDDDDDDEEREDVAVDGNVDVTDGVDGSASEDPGEDDPSVADNTSDPPSLDEDSDIQDDTHHISQAGSHLHDSQSLSDQQRTRSRTFSMPSDPVDISTLHDKLSRRSSNQDRFSASFINSDMWTTDDDTTLERSKKPQRTLSGDVSILTDSDLTGSIRFKQSGVTESLPSSSSSSSSPKIQFGGALDNHSSVERTRTPTTTRRSGSRNRSNAQDLVNHFSIDIHGGAHDSIVNGDDDDDSNNYDTLIKDHSKPSGRRTGERLSPRSNRRSPNASSPRRKTYSPRNRNADSIDNDDEINRHREQIITLDATFVPPRRKGLRSAKPRRQPDREHARHNHHQQEQQHPQQQHPDGFPNTPVPEIEMVRSNHRSPLSSSLTLTPNSRSMMSSSRQHSRQRLKNSCHLDDYIIQEENDPYAHDDASSMDGYTLGASTITTNFSMAQRTIGENTVSTRSLFSPSEKLRVSETPQIPRRRNDDDDDEHHHWEAHIDHGEHVAFGNKPSSAGQSNSNRHPASNTDTADMAIGPRMVLRKPSVDSSDSFEKSIMLDPTTKGHATVVGDAHVAIGDDVSEASSVDSTQLRERSNIGQHGNDNEGAAAGHQKGLMKVNAYPDSMRIDTTATAGSKQYQSQKQQQQRSAKLPSEDPFDGMKTDDFDSVSDDLYCKKPHRAPHKLRIFPWRNKKSDVVPLEDDGSSELS